jgi:hypothetical protein
LICASVPNIRRVGVLEEDLRERRERIGELGGDARGGPIPHLFLRTRGGRPRDE